MAKLGRPKKEDIEAAMLADEVSSANDEQLEILYNTELNLRNKRTPKARAVIAEAAKRGISLE